MITKNTTPKKILLHVLKNFSSTHTITALAKELHFSRVGIWKILKKLESSKYLFLEAVGTSEKSTFLVTLNWENPLVEKALSLYLTEEAVTQGRWRVNFEDLESETDFVILYGSVLHSPQEAHDVDILSIAQKKNFVAIQKSIDKIQKTQAKKIHPINFTESEFTMELKKRNKAFIDALKKGVVLFGQDTFVQFMRNIAK